MSTITHDFDNLPKKKHYSAKLKERITELQSEIDTLVFKRDSAEAMFIETKYKHLKNTEKMMWSGKINDAEGFNGFINNIFNNEQNK